MTDEEVIESVVQHVCEGGYSSIRYLIENMDVEELREIYGYEEEDDS